MFFLMFLGAVCFSFIKVMQMTRDCRVVTISTNKMMIPVMAEFHLAGSREFLFVSHVLSCAQRMAEILVGGGGAI